MENLTKFIALEKLLQTIGHGTVNLGLSVRAGKIVGITTTGAKKTLYNQSEKDENTNTKALEYILRRIHSQLESKSQGELVFKIVSNFDKIKVVEITSTQTIK